MSDTPRAQSGEERLREKVFSIVIEAVIREQSLDKSDAMVYPTEQQRIYSQETDKIMQAVKAEIGAAIGKDEPPDTVTSVGIGYSSRLFGRNEVRAELRNHFGIKESTDV